MTLLVSFYSSSGIVYAADSAISELKGSTATRHSKQDKLQRITQVGVNGGIVGYFGLAEVNGNPMDNWLRQKIDQWPGSESLSGFGDYLCDALNKEVPPNVRQANASGFHTGCFEDRNGIIVPVMHYVTNIYGMDVDTGAYSAFGEYHNSENFPSHPDETISWSHVPPAAFRTVLRAIEENTGLPHWFRNGELAFAVRGWEGLMLAVREITSSLDTRFRSPSDLSRWEMLADLLVRTNGHLFALLVSTGDPTIEGPYKAVQIPWP